MLMIGSKVNGYKNDSIVSNIVVESMSLIKIAEEIREQYQVNIKS